MIDAVSHAADHSFTSLKRLRFERDDPEQGELQIEALFCGVCHSDIHQVENGWSDTVYPCRPGHEIVGRVTHLGPGVSKHAVGDLVGVGC